MCELGRASDKERVGFQFSWDKDDIDIGKKMGILVGETKGGSKKTCGIDIPSKIISVI